MRSPFPPTQLMSPSREHSREHSLEALIWRGSVRPFSTGTALSSSCLHLLRDGDVSLFGLGFAKQAFAPWPELPVEHSAVP